MEHRSDLEEFLLASLPEQERRQTVHSMTEAHAERLRRLLADGPPDFSGEEGDDEFGDD